LFIGARGDGAGGTVYEFDGKIDDLRIYDRVLSANEAKQLYEEGLN
jgi:hypothetical protein